MKRILFLAVLTLGLSGCAALFNAQSKGVMFTSDPTGADVLINGRLFGHTPISVNLKQKSDYAITFRQSGYEDRSYRVNNHIGAGWIVLDVLGGLFPVAIDAASGSWYSLDNTSVHGVLPPSKIPATQDSVAVAPAPQPSQPPAGPLGQGSWAVLPGVPYTITLEGGSTLAANSVEQSGTDMLKVMLTSGKTEYVAAAKVQYIMDKDGTDWTRKVVMERGRVPPR